MEVMLGGWYCVRPTEGGWGGGSVNDDGSKEGDGVNEDMMKKKNDKSELDLSIINSG